MRRVAAYVFAICLSPVLLAQGHGVVECECPDPMGFDARGFWTKEAIRAAEPMELPNLSDEDVRKLRLFELPGVEPSKVFALPASPLTGTAASVRPVQEADVTVPPHNAVGKLFFTTRAGKKGYCTAQLVGDDAMILTAAHCVRDKKTGDFYEKFSFIGGYKDEDGEFSYVVCVGTWSTFPHTTNPNFAVDYAFGRLKDPLSTHLGIAEALPASEWISVGYPKDVQRGERQQFVRGGQASTSNNLVEMANNPFKDGASGGGWLADVPRLGRTAIGLNSYRSGTSMYGPLFDSGVGKLYAHVFLGRDCRTRTGPN